MKLEIDLPPARAKRLLELISEWQELSPHPFTNFEKLHKVEKEISLQLTYSILHDEFLDRLKEELGKV